MSQRSKAVALAAVAVIGTFTSGLSSVVRADDLTLTPQYGHSAPLYMDEAPAAPDKPLAALLKKSGIDTGEIQIYGWVEGSYTYSFSNPPDNFIAGRAFDIDNQEIILNQIDLTIEKTVDSAAAAKDNRMNIGGKVEWVYGNDARFIHANGLNFYGPGVQLSPENQFDLLQAYVDIALPVGNGMMVRAGKFTTIIGYETIQPLSNAFYSHAYLFAYGPYTNTGVLAYYNLTEKTTVAGGFSRGWDQALEDNNSVIDYLGQIKHVFSDKATGYFNFITGPEADNDNGNWRTLLDTILTVAITDQLTLGFNGDFGWEGGAVAGNNDYALWYGTAVYGGYKINDYVALNARGEWFDDDDGARGIGTTVWEATFGMTIHPFPHDDLGSNLVIRPEIRCDYANDPIWDGNTQNTQWTAAIDAIFAF